MAREQDIVSLPFRLTDFNEDMIVLINRNFAEIERMLSQLQMYEKKVGKPINENYNNFVGTVYPSDLENIQNQIDGKITSWFYNYEPTLLNEPASLWTTNDEKSKHLGDLFYDVLSGYGYRFAFIDNAYQWGRIIDTDVITALANAQRAQDTADGKRRVFTATPIPPYDVGDLWTPGASGQIKKCKTAKTEGQSYSALDWESASNALQENVSYENVQFGTGIGIKVSHDNGSYTQMKGDGLKYHSIYDGIARDYHYLTEMGRSESVGGFSAEHTSGGWQVADEAACLTHVPPITIQLPDDFKGKKFKVFAEPRFSEVNISRMNNLFFQSNSVENFFYQLRNWVCEAYDYDYVNATFKVKAYSWARLRYHYLWDYNVWLDEDQEWVDPMQITYSVIA